MLDSLFKDRKDLLQLETVTSLGGSYRQAFKRLYSFVEPLMRGRPIGSEEFSDHDVQHSARVLQNIERILPKGVNLNDSEKYILVCSCLLHDMGMWSSKQECLDSLAESAFLSYAREHFRDEVQEVRLHLEENGPKAWMAKLGLQRLFAAYVRSEHPQRIARILLGPKTESDVQIAQLMDNAFTLPVALVCEAHSWSKERILNDNLLRARQYNGMLTNLRYLAELLRLGDLLDMGDARISSLVWDYLRPMSPTSEAYWRKDAALIVENLCPDEIRVSGRFDVDHDGSVASEAYKLARDWLAELGREIERCALPMMGRMEDVFRTRGHGFGKLILDSKEVQAIGLVLEGSVSFELQLDKLITLLGREIYDDKLIFVRELLQNAVDATRTQLLKTNEAEISSHRLSARDVSSWPPEILSGEDALIIVRIGVEKLHDLDYVIYEVKDQGIGMTPRQIRENFLQIGKSYYQSLEYIQQFEHPTISRFGIGFLTCLLASQRIEVVTRAHGETRGAKLWLEQPSHLFVAEPADCDFGTLVKLWLKPEVLRQCKLNAIAQIPIDSGLAEAISYIYGGRSVPRLSDESELPELVNLLEAVSEFEYPLPEVGIVLNSRMIKPRSIASIEPVTRDIVFSSRPLTVIGKDSKNLIAQGNIMFKVIKNGPLVTHDSPGLGGLVGVVLFERGFLRGTIHDESYNRLHPSAPEILISLDISACDWAFARPSRDLSTSDRQLAWHIEARTRRNLFLHYLHELRTIDARYAAIWQLFVQRTLFSSSRKPVLEFHLPCRNATTVEWLPLSEIVSRYDRFCVVPFDLAASGPWTSSMPCVGFVKEAFKSRPPDLGDFGLDAYRRIDLRRSPLVVAQEEVTGILVGSPEGCDLPLFSSTATWLPDGLFTWAEGVETRTMLTGSRLPEDAITNKVIHESDLPQYDRDGNPWVAKGFENRYFSRGKFRREFHQGIPCEGPLEIRIEIPESLVELAEESRELFE